MLSYLLHCSGVNRLHCGFYFYHPQAAGYFMCAELEFIEMDGMSSARRPHTFAHVAKDHEGLGAVWLDGVDAANSRTSVEQLAAV